MEVLKIGSVAILSAAALTFARPSFAQDAAPLPPTETAPVAESVPPIPPTAPLPSPAAPLPAHAALTPLPAAPAMPPIESAAEIERVHPYIAVHRSERVVHGHKIRHVSIDVDTSGASAEDLKRMHAEVARAAAEAREAQAENLRAEAEERRQEAEIRFHEAQMRALQEAGPRIDAEVRAALAKAQPEIDRAVAEAHLRDIDLKISEQVHNAFKHARVRIEMKDHTKIILHDNPDQDGQDAPDAN